MSRWLYLVPALAVLVGAGCRVKRPEEIVYTGKPKTVATATPTQRPPPSNPPVIPPPPTTPFSKRALLGAIADCTLQHVRAFEGAARPLRDAVQAHASARTQQTNDAAHDAWRAATVAWQELESFRIGPAASSSFPGGRDLRDQIDAWPLFSRCKVDEQLVASAYAGSGFGTSSLVNARGLATLEYLSFYGGAENGCTELSSINAQGTWIVLGDGERAKRRADYAAVVADAALARAQELLRAWDPAQENFHRELAQAGAGATVYASDQAALNAASDALFYLDKELKDSKVGRPVGLIDCPTETCPQGLESPWARASLSNVRANLRGFRQLFQGCGEGGAGFGFDDWLNEVGAKDVTSHMLDALARVEQTAAELEPSLEEVVALDAPHARLLHADLKALSDILKTEFVTVLNLELPKTAEGDND